VRFDSLRGITSQAVAVGACSWGVFQIMGYHWRELGFPAAEEFQMAMFASEGNQLDAFVRYVQNDPALLKALRAHKWADFARLYNGPAYAENSYDAKLAAAYARFAPAEEAASMMQTMFGRIVMAALLAITLAAGFTLWQQHGQLQTANTRLSEFTEANASLTTTTNCKPASWWPCIAMRITRPLPPAAGRPAGPPRPPILCQRRKTGSRHSCHARRYRLGQHCYSC
jgi:hypothetical protein